MAVSFSVPFASAAPPQPYTLWGLARLSDGSTPVPIGTRITGFIDGVDYSNTSIVYRADGSFNVDVYGDWVTGTGNPNTPAVKEGGNVGEEIMYVAGDFATVAQVFTTKKFWVPADYVNDNLQLAPPGNQPGLLKVGRITTRPADGLSQYVYLCNPTSTVINADGFYLHKDVPGSFNGPQHSLVGVGNIGPGGLAYVNLTLGLSLVATGDNLKLVWRNTGPAFGGTDIIVDRVEFNQTGGGGTLFWEPGNTVMTDAPAPGLGQQINRTALCADTNNNAVDFTLSGETGRPGANTAPTVALTEPNGGQDWTGGTVHPIRWSMSDVEDSQMTVAISLSLNSGTIWPISVTTGTYLNGARAYSWTVNLENTTNARIRVCVFDSGAMSSCAISAADFTIDSARPTLDATVPPNGATLVDPVAPITLTFSEGMNRTATQAAFSIAPNPGGLVFSWDAPSRVLTVNHNPLADNTAHTVTVACGAKDDSDTGNALAACPRSFSFTTTTGPKPPVVDVTRPDGGEVWSGASIQSIFWNMTDPDSPGNLNVDIFYSTDGGTTWNPIVTAQSRAQGANSFSWSVPLINTQTARVRVCASDGLLQGCDGSLANFTIDSIRPTVITVDPPTGATGVPLGKIITIVFSEAMSQAATFSAFSTSPNPGGWGPGVGNWIAPDTVQLSHNQFAACQDYGATIAATARDRSSPGNGLAAPYVWSFRTACPPQVAIASPAGGEVWSGGASRDILFTITDEDSTVQVWINLSTDGGTTWSLLAGPSPYPTGSQQSATVTIPPTDAATAMIRVTAQDSALLDGLRNSGTFSIDATPPTVTVSTPAQGAQDVGVSADFTITFSEPMDRASTESAIALDPPAAPLTFSWNAQSTQVTITHPTLLTGRWYNLTVGVSALDASSPGNAFASPHRISFRTSSVGAVVANPGGPYTTQVGAAVQFDGSASVGNIVNYTWQVTLPSGSVFGYGERPLFTFQAAGTFPVSLTVRDGAGNTHSAETTVAVTGGPEGPDFIGQFWWLFLILIVAIVLALLFVLMRRRKKEEAMPAEVPPEEVETIPPPAARAPPAPPAKPAAPPVKPAAPPAVPAAPPPKAKPTTRECPNCGTIVDATDADCFMCGAKL